MLDMHEGLYIGVDRAYQRLGSAIIGSDNGRDMKISTEFSFFRKDTFVCQMKANALHNT